MVLWDEEDQSYDERDDDDSPSERVPRDIGEKRDEEVVDRVIDGACEK